MLINIACCSPLKYLLHVVLVSANLAEKNDLFSYLLTFLSGYSSLAPYNIYPQIEI